MDNDLHKKYTGVENILILNNLSKLLKKEVCVWIRVPVIIRNSDVLRHRQLQAENVTGESWYVQRESVFP